MVLALVFVAVGRSVAVRSMLPILLAVLGVGILIRAAFVGRRAETKAPELPQGAESARGTLSSRPDIADLVRFSRGTLSPSDLLSDARVLHLDGTALRLLTGGEPKPLLDLSTPFGLTLLSNRKRDRAVLAVTSKNGSFLLGGRFGRSERPQLQSLLARASVIPTEEVAFDAIGPDGRAIELGAKDFKALVDALESVDPTAQDRLLLSDPSGEPLELHGDELVVRGHHFDLTRPLEWRSMLFQESFGQAFALYQGTWIRQGASEVVLVSLLPAAVLDPSPLDFEAAGNPDLDVRAMRDQRLMQATAGAPPPNEQRVAVDGLFMLPLRVALDGAPRSSKIPESARHV